LGEHQNKVLAVKQSTDSQMTASWRLVKMLLIVSRMSSCQKNTKNHFVKFLYFDIACQNIILWIVFYLEIWSNAGHSAGK